MGAQPMGAPGCPDAARSTMSAPSTRTVLTALTAWEGGGGEDGGGRAAGVQLPAKKGQGRFEGREGLSGAPREQARRRKNSRCR